MFALAGVAVLAALAALVFGTLAEGGGKAQAVQTVTITAEANGSLPPLPPPLDCPYVNGGFTINIQVGGVPGCGDGANEFTDWTLVFTGDPGFPAFKACGGPLVSALLTLELTPLGPLLGTDTVTILGLGQAVDNPLIQTLYNANPPDLFPALPGDTRRITADLLTTTGLTPPGPVLIAPNDFRDFFTVNAGEIPMRYQDDSIVSFAQLELTIECPPGPDVVGGVAGLLDGGESPADASGSSGRDYTAPIAAAVAAAVIALAAAGWYARRRLS